jgi:hypothetical protein
MQAAAGCLACRKAKRMLQPAHTCSWCSRGGGSGGSSGCLNSGSGGGGNGLGSWLGSWGGSSWGSRLELWHQDGVDHVGHGLQEK